MMERSVLELAIEDAPFFRREAAGIILEPETLANSPETLCI